MLQLFSIGWLSVSVLAQADDTLLDRIPLWAIGLAVLLIIVFAVAWTLREEEQAQATAAALAADPEIRATAVVETTVSAPEAAPLPADDLTIIEGIGPRIAGLLQANGITNFAQLAAAEIATLREMMTAARLQIANPESWPEQAALAAAGDWAALATLQENLKGGRRA